MKQKMNKKIDNIFVRFGKLHLTKQDGYGQEGFHKPPAPKGFYSMPMRFQEYFLISSMANFQSKQLNLPKKLDREEIYKIEDDDEREKLYGERSDYIQAKMSAIRHEFYVVDSKEIWHHLCDAPRNEIIAEHDCWVKTTVGTYKKALMKQSVIDRASSLESKGEYGFNGFNKIRSGKTGYCSKDHYEVFFDSKVY